MKNVFWYVKERRETRLAWIENDDDDMMVVMDNEQTTFWLNQKINVCGVNFETKQ